MRQGVWPGRARVTTATPVWTPDRAPAWAPRWVPYELNSGGPCSRTRTERIHSTVLGDDDGPIRCPRVLRVGIDFGRRKPLTCVRDWLKAVGFADEEEARGVLSLPPGPRICAIDPAPQPAPAAQLTALDGLRLTLVLGLCTPCLYDPHRPVLWTQASLARQLVLYDGGGFYA